MISYIISDKNCVLQNRNTEYLLIEWKGRTGTNTWLGVMTYGPRRSPCSMNESHTKLTSVSILSYDHQLIST